MGVITTGVPNEISCKFEMFALRIKQVVQDYLSVAFLYVVSIQWEKTYCIALIWINQDQWSVIKDLFLAYMVCIWWLDF